MGLHQRHAHKRGITGEEAAAHLVAEKRDSHRNTVMMHIPDEFQEKMEQKAEASASTLYSIVYVTASATFTGPTAGYITMTAPAPVTATSTLHRHSSVTSAVSSAVIVETDTASPVASSSTAALASSASTFTSSVIVAGSTSTATLATNVVAGTPLSATRTATADSTDSGVTSSGMSGGAKAGLAIGILLAIAAMAGLVLFCMRRRKNKNSAHGEVLDEKRNSFYSGSGNVTNEKTNRFSNASDRVAPSIRTNRTASTAPRLSLRPVTQFMGFGLNQAENTSGEMAEKPSVWERRPANTAEDPFRDTAAIDDKTVNPFEEPEAAAAKTVGSANHSSKSSYEEIMAPIVGTAAAVSVNAAAPAVNNVHRVQLDFKPSMEDELELRSGQLVRMLHEYDDGWVSSFVPRLPATIADFSTGTLYSHGPLSAGCDSSYLLVQGMI